MDNLKQDFISHLLARYPSLATQPRDIYENLVSDNLLCPHTLHLPLSLKSDLESAIFAFSELRDALKKSGKLRPDLEHRGLNDPGNQGIMMSADFHIDSLGKPKLIEINTNAAFSILGSELYKARGLTAVVEFSPATWLNDLKEEISKSGHDLPAKPLVVIVDDNPSSQKLYIEFLVAKAWIESQGWLCEIRDVRDVAKNPVPNFVYNRHTDFFLEREESRDLRTLLIHQEACVSPQPYEYLLLADKNRLIEWSREENLAALGLSEKTTAVLKAVIPASHDQHSLTPEELWNRRKGLFFKPKNEFGSKQAFRGSSISRKMFDELMTADGLAQEFVPAPEVTFETEQGVQTFKYDLRCYFYGNRWEGVIARVYQGQVTNLRTPGGGFAPVVFE